MKAIAPQYFTWDAERSVMVPKNAKLADRTYTDTETYRLGVIEERSANSHAHYFASLHEIWMNLPDTLSLKYPTEERLRKIALIATGWCEQKDFVCSTPEQAQRLARFMPQDDDRVLIVDGLTVRCLTAKSQSHAAMGKADFQKSKQDVLDWCSNLIGVKAGEVPSNRGQK